MDASVLGAVGDALVAMADPMRFALLFGGVILGLFLGIVPGIGGLAGMALLLPFTYTMDPYSAFAMLLGMLAVTNTSDTISAVLFGVPGSAGAQATVIDGNAMAKRGEAQRALGAAYFASMIGGLFGALLLGLTIPALRPLMLHIASPELLALSILGIAMVAVLSGNAPMKGLIVAGIGILLAMVGVDSQVGQERWTFGSSYLWDGLPLIPIVLGLFALPELADLAVNRRSIVDTHYLDTRSTGMQGVRDVFRNWWLVARCGGLGAAVGAIPGLGAGIVDWIAYGYATQTIKGPDAKFGQGDVRGVIAPEAANNSVTAGALVPTIAFGIPGSATMSVLLGVFLIHGLVPGPAMLTQNLDVTYVMVWSVAIANILGTVICFAFSGPLSKIALLRHTLIIPPVLTFVVIGTFQASQRWGDLLALLVLFVIGWGMKQLRWPRPPLMLGFVLGAMIERYMFISNARYGFDWLLRPAVVVVLLLAALVLLRPILRRMRMFRRGGSGAWQFRAPDLAYVAVILLVGAMLAEAAGWPQDARIGPMIVGLFVLGCAGLALLLSVAGGTAPRPQAGADAAGDIYFDSVSDTGDMTQREVLGRSLVFLGYLLGFIISTAVIGLLPTIPLFFVLYMRLEQRERWPLVLGCAVFFTLMCWGIFDALLLTKWPATLLGSWFPALTAIPSV